MSNAHGGRVRAAWIVSSSILGTALVFGTIAVIRLTSPSEVLPHTEEQWRQLFNSAWELSRKGQHESAIYAGQQLVRSAERLFGEDDARLADALLLLARIHVNSDAQRFVRALDLNEKTFDRDKIVEYQRLWQQNPDEAVRRFHQGELRGQVVLKRELARREQRLGKENFALTPFITALADFYTEQGAAEPAKTLYERAIAICLTSRGPDDRATADALQQLATYYSRRSQDEMAIRLLARAAEIYLRVPDAEWQAAQPLSLIAVTYHNRHRYDEAEEYAKLVLALLEQSSQVSPWQLIGALERLALTYQAHGRYEQAEELYRRSLGLQEKLEGGQASYRLESTLRNLRTVLRELGEYEESSQMQARADQILQQLKASRAAAQGQSPTSP